MPFTDTMAPCDPWPVQWPCDVSCLSPTVTGTAVQMATEIVWAMSGRQFGQCTITLRPCRRVCGDFPTGWGLWTWGGWTYPQPALLAGKWYNLVCSCGDDCTCTTLEEALLPGYIDSVTTVKVDGSPLVTGAYRLDNDRLLVRTDGGRWPFCNDLTKADTQPGTWSVTAVYGHPVPTSGQWAVGELACELAKALNNEACKLPRNITQLTRQGVSMNFGDVSLLFTNRLTGLYLTDLFIQTFNPHGLPIDSRTYSIDRPKPRRVGT